ncbi:hypothetical protein [Pseudovibrio sp. POLY-S9]|uniref:hypothetical protein n=1 Tax=Pseudovibrio sp. POLY-S9 TaxID=1576596 RepID=UPI00070E686C|nr:hypothetical protein [Pseudovibrio sp. POLY-S9]
MRLSAVCDHLDFSKQTVGQWINRGIFKVDQETKPGSARQLTFKDAMRLAILTKAANANLPLNEVHSHLNHLTALKDQKAFLVITDALLELVPATERGGKGSKRGDGVKVYQEGALTSDVIKASELADHLSSPNHTIALVVCLDTVEAEIKSFWR